MSKHSLKAKSIRADNIASGSLSSGYVNKAYVSTPWKRFWLNTRYTRLDLLIFIIVSSVVQAVLSCI